MSHKLAFSGNSNTNHQINEWLCSRLTVVLLSAATKWDLQNVLQCAADHSHFRAIMTYGALLEVQKFQSSSFVYKRHARRDMLSCNSLMTRKHKPNVNARSKHSHGPPRMRLNVLNREKRPRTRWSAKTTKSKTKKAKQTKRKGAPHMTADHADNWQPRSLLLNVQTVTNDSF